MSTYKTILFSTLASFLFLVFGCADNPLDEQPYSQIAPENLFQSEGGVESLLASAYANASFMQRTRINQMNEWMTDISWQTHGGENRVAVLFINYTFDATNGIITNWYNNHYNAIRDANTLLDNLDVAQISDELKTQYRAEARFVRAFAYYQMYKKFGPVPLRTSTQQSLHMPRASEQEMEDFIETELREIIPNLPNKGEIEYGRATKGAARGVLTKFFLNTQQWEKTATMAQNIMDMGTYGLYPDYWDVFQVSNEGNESLLWVFTADPSVPPANNIMNGTQPSFPSRWQYWPKIDLTYQSSWNNWASNYRIRDAFYNTFDPQDTRRDPFMVEYVNFDGDTVNLIDCCEDNIRSFKYIPTSDAQANFYGNDYPIVRYADILLSRAEALVHTEGGVPQESIELINQVRDRAYPDTVNNWQVSASDFSGSEDLLDHILQERGWEFYYEGKRWEDMKRHGVLIDRAQARGVNARDCHTRLPIPQTAIDSNDEITQQDQNECYR